jgi:hypothetical protein
LLMLQLLECAGMILFDSSKYIRTLQHKGWRREGAPFVKSVHSWGPWTCLVLRLLRLCLTDFHGDPTQLFHSQHKKFLQGWADKLTSHGAQRYRMSPVFMARHCQRRISQGQHRLISMFEIRYCLIMFLFCYVFVMFLLRFWVCLCMNAAAHQYVHTFSYSTHP